MPLPCTFSNLDSTSTRLVFTATQHPFSRMATCAGLDSFNADVNDAVDTLGINGCYSWPTRFEYRNRYLAATNDSAIFFEEDATAFFGYPGDAHDGLAVFGTSYSFGGTSSGFYSYSSTNHVSRGSNNLIPREKLKCYPYVCQAGKCC